MLGSLRLQIILKPINKKPISFTQKSHSIKLLRYRKPGHFVKIKKMGSIGPSVLLKGTLDKMHEKQKAKKLKQKI